jgi:hypothetical protein
MEESPFYPPPMNHAQYQAQHPPPLPPPHHNTFPSSSNNSQHTFYTSYPPHPQVRQVRRYKTVKRLVQIPQGKLVFDCPVPIQYLERVSLRDVQEFNFMRYSGSSLKENVLHNGRSLMNPNFFFFV